VFLLALIAVALACAATPLLQWQSAQARSRVDSGLAAKALQASGTIRAEEVLVASEYGGRLATVLVREGQSVAANDVVVQLDTSLLDAQIQAAEAGIALAQAGLVQARAGSRPGQIAVAAAQLAQAEAGRLAAMQAVSDTKALVANPQDIQLQIAVTQAEIQSAEHKLAQALARKDATQIGKDKFEEAQEAIQDMGGPGQHRIRVQIAQGPIGQIPPDIRNRLPPVLGDGRYTLGDLELEIHGGTFTLYRWITVNVDLPFEAHLAPNMWWQAWVGVNAAAAQKEGYDATLNLLWAQRTNPQDLKAQADAAVALLTQAEAQVKAAQAQVDALQAGTTPEQIAALEAKVQQAQATLDSLMSQRAQMSIVAPIGGTVTSIAVHEGEVAAKGTTLLTIADLRQVKLTVYLPEDQIGLISLGQVVQVAVDSFPGRAFEGRVEHIADQAEFLPRNVATQEERVNLVFAIDVSLSNERGELKPGMPADASFGQ
jgi:multidrug resistance efflux pump